MKQFSTGSDYSIGGWVGCRHGRLSSNRLLRVMVKEYTTMAGGKFLDGSVASS